WSPPPVIGSLSENAVRKGFVHDRNVFQAFLFASEAGSSGAMGTSIGNWRAPALYESSGNGALYAPATSGGTSWWQPRLTITPTSKSSTSWDNRCHRMNPSPAGVSPVGK